MLKKTIVLILKIMVLTIVMAILFTLGSALLGPKIAGSAAGTAQAGSGLPVLLMVSLVDTLILTAIILRSRLWGWRLMILVGVFFYGVKTFMSIIEAWYFMQNVTPEMLPGLFMMYLGVTFFFPPVAVWMLGKIKKPADADAPNERMLMPAGQLTAKLAVLSVLVYPILFFGFGYYVAWQNPELRAFYHGVDEGSIIAHLSVLFSGDPVVYPFEIARGLLWVGLAALVIRWNRGSAWEAGLIVALSFALIQNDVHFFNNPLMPRSVSMTHFVETASSNFIWAWAITWLMHRAHRSLADLFGSRPPKVEAEAQRVVHT